eukprot:COSAG01_NODE_965_length_12401_cov_3.496098_1_plen_130_part_10
MDPFLPLSAVPKSAKRVHINITLELVVAHTRINLETCAVHDTIQFSASSGDSAGARVVCTGAGTTAGAVDCISTERSGEHVELSQRKPLVGYAEATLSVGDNISITPRPHSNTATTASSTTRTSIVQHQL